MKEALTNASAPAPAQGAEPPATFVQLHKSIGRTIAVLGRGFYRLGGQLREMRDEKHYRPHYRSFEEYCKVWCISRQHADRLIKAYDKREILSPTGDMAKFPNFLSERHLRPLTALGSDRESVIAVAEQVEALAAKGEPVTASVIEREVERVVPRRNRRQPQRGGKAYERARMRRHQKQDARRIEKLRLQKADSIVNAIGQLAMTLDDFPISDLNAFARENLSRLPEVEGEGYAKLARLVVAIQEQITARLASA